MAVLKYWDQASGTYKPISGPPGPVGPAGAGFPTGGVAGTVLRKNSSTDFDTAWNADVASFNTRTGNVVLTQADMAGVGVLNDIGRNKLHNAMFRIQQRGAGSWTIAGTVYGPDRWYGSASVDTSSFAIGATSDAARAAVSDEEFIYYLNFNVTGSATAGAYTLLSQGIEGVRRLANKTITLSFWAQVNTPGLKIGVSFDQYFGSGGSPSTGVSMNNTAVFTTPDAGWHRYSCTTTLPSASGKTLGTNNDDKTTLNIWLSSSATFAARSGIGAQTGSLTFWGMQLEVGSVMTPLEKIDIALEQRECMRFYQTGAFQLAGYATASVAATYSIPLGTPLRSLTQTVTPTFTVQTNCGSSSVAAQSSGPLGQILQCNTIVTGTGNFNFAGTYTVSADL